MGEKDVLIAPDLGDISAATFDRSADADQDRRGSDARDGRQAQALQPAARPVRGAAQDAGRRGEGARHRRRDPRRGAGAHEPGGGARRWSRASRASRSPRRRSAPTCAASTGPATSRASATGSSAGDIGPRAMVIEPKEKSWGADYLRFGLGLASDFQGDNAFNAARPVPEDLAQPPGRRMADRGPDRPEHASVHRVLPAGERGGAVVRRRPAALIGQQTRGAFVGEDKVADYLISVGAGRGRRRREPRNLGPGARAAPSGRRSTRGSTPALRCCLRSGRRRRGCGRRCSSTRRTTPASPRRATDCVGHGLRRDDVVRIGAQLPAARGSGARHPGAGDPTRSTSPPAAARRSGRTCPRTNPSRSAVRCGCRATASTSSRGASSRSAG